MEASSADLTKRTSSFKLAERASARRVASNTHKPVEKTREKHEKREHTAELLGKTSRA